MLEGIVAETRAQLNEQAIAHENALRKLASDGSRWQETVKKLDAQLAAMKQQKETMLIENQV